MDRIVSYYRSKPESGRLERGRDRLEFARVQELIRRFARPPPAKVLDSGGGTGKHAAWLAEDGYDVHLIDLLPEHVAASAELAATLPHSFTSAVGDARHLPEGEPIYDLVLLLGPLYHLIDRDDRLLAWAEAARVTKSDGIIMGMVFSRWSGMLDEVLRPPAEPAPGFVPITYFHGPDEAVREASDAGLEVTTIVGVDGPGWLVSDFEARWGDDAEREDLLQRARETEDIPELLGLHAHLLVVARRRM